MKAIEFTTSSANKVYTDYLKRIKRTTSKLSRTDQEDVLMEFNSHIYESMQYKSEDLEIDRLLNVIDKLGAPEEVLQPLVAEKTLAKATRTFNPVTVFTALFLNIGKGFSYIMFGLLYLFLFVFVFVILTKIAWPNEVGLYFQNGEFRVIGMVNQDMIDNHGYKEVLGNLFIPVMLAVTVGWYLLITLILKLKERFF